MSDAVAASATTAAPATGPAPAPPPEGLEQVLLRPLRGVRWPLLLGSIVTGILTVVMFAAWGVQIRDGLGVSGLNRPVFWGFYITNFVFWIGISHAGTLISAILRVTQAEWRRPITRLAEAVTVFAIAVGGLFPIIHLGRPLVFWYMLPLPGQRGLWPNFRSPLAWDVAAISTYLLGSLLYLFLPLIPDLSALRDRSGPGLRGRLYRLLALGWRGTQTQWHVLEAGIRTLAVVIIPVAISVHTIVSWDFAMSQQPMWHSTIFGPYFVVGAIYSGIAVLMIAMAVLRVAFGLRQWLDDRTFSHLGLLFVAMTMLWGYFTWAEHLTVWYGDHVGEHEGVWARGVGEFSGPFWTMVVCCFVVPIAVLPWRWGRRPLPLGLVGASVLVGMWLERFLIVVPTLSFPRLGFTVGDYSASGIEWAILIGAFGLFGFLYFGFLQLVPIVSLWEVREGELVARERLASASAASAVSAETVSAASTIEIGDTDEAVELVVDDLEQLPPLLRGLEERGLAPRQVEVASAAPLPARLLASAGGHPARHPWLLAIAGGLSGCAASVGLATLTALDYPLVTGGMPIVAAPPTGVLAFEGTALGAIFATVGWVLWRARLVPGRRLEPLREGEQVAAGRVVVRVRGTAS